jgi:hypothetical protein
MMIHDPRYEPVEQSLPEVLPPISMKDALGVYKRLVKTFGKTKDIPVGVLEQRGGRPIGTNRQKARRCWASTKPTKSHYKGWGRLIHDASHYVFKKRHPRARPHDGGHATLEREMVEWVMKKGLIEKTLKKGVKKPKTVDSKMLAIDASIERWERKAKRAENALKKLHRRKKALTSRLDSLRVTSI